MKLSTSRASAFLATTLLSASAAAQFHPAPPPWQAVVDAMARGQPPFHTSVHSEMEPLQFQAKPWQVTLVVENTIPARGAFCHGALVAPGWLLTAASCVCSMKQGDQGFEVITQPQTSTQPARRTLVRSGAPYANAIWLFQREPRATPATCLAPGVYPPLGVTPTVHDLALVWLGENASIPAAAGAERREIAMMGTPPTHTLLASLAENVLPTSAPPASAPVPLASQTIRTIQLESVVLASRSGMTATRASYPVIGDFVVNVEASLRESPCVGLTTEVATSVTPAGMRVCGSLTLGEGQSTVGTPVVMTDHKNPLLLGIQGLTAYTPLTLSAAATAASTPTIAMTAQRFVNSFKPDLPAPTDDNWRPLHAANTGSPPPQCSNVEWKFNEDGVDVFRVNGPPSPYRRAFVFRTARLTAVARGSPRAYHPDDIDDALDVLSNANFPGDWENDLVADPFQPSKPYVQRTGQLQPGFYVSMTDLRDLGYGRRDPRRYVDAERIAFIVQNKKWSEDLTDGVSLGDFVAAKSLVTRGGVTYDGRMAGGIIAHVGAAGMGSMSMQMGQRLTTVSNQKFDPKRGVDPQIDVLVMVFPNTRTAAYEHMRQDQIETLSQNYLEQANHWPDLKCLVRPPH